MTIWARPAVRVAGALEGDCLPTGEWAIALLNGTIATDQGFIPGPTITGTQMDRLRYLTIRRDPTGTFHMAGQGQDTEVTWEWIGGKWFDRGPNQGERPCIYDRTGALIIARPEPGQVVEGWTYGFGDTIVHTPRYDATLDLHEFTHAGPYIIGQSSLDGIDLLWDKRYQLEPGDVHTIWARYGSGVVATATRKLAQNQTVCLWIEPGQIPTLPLAPRKTIPPVDKPPIDPPKEKPPVNFPTAEWAVVTQMHQRFAKDFPETEDGARGWTEKTIQQPVFRFPTGGWCWKSGDTTRPPSKDGIARQVEGRFEGWDVLNAAGEHGPRDLADYPPGYHDLAGQHPIPVSGHDWLGGVVVEPPSDLPARVAALEHNLADARTAITLLTDEVELLNRRLTDHLKNPGEGGFDPRDYKVTFAPGSATGSSFGHKHSVSLVGDVVKK